MEHKKVGTDLFNAIQNSSENHESTIKEEDRKNLFYKPFKFQQENIEDVAGMLSKIQTLLNQSYKDDHLLLEKKMLEAQDALVKECEKIYSERIRYNQQLQSLAQSTIIPYYHGRFQISLSREISFLPLELRLYIYTQLLAIEVSTIRQMHLLDRIALTLHKSGETFLGDISIFVSSWMKTKLSKVTFGTKKDFLPLYITEIESIQSAASLRERILSDAEITPEIAGREFWYGLKGFSSPSSIHNYEAATICFDLFSNYFKGSFSIVEKLQPILNEAFTTQSFQEIDRCLEEEGLDEITISKRYIQATYISDTFKEFSATEVEKMDEAQRSYANELVKGYKESSYLYINPSKEKVSDEQLRIPETLSPTKAAYYIDNLLHILNFKRMLLSDFDEYIMKMSTSIISSEDWGTEKRNIVLGTLAEIYGLVWLRNTQSKKDTLALLKILMAILTKDKLLDKYSQGKGWPIAIIIEETNKTQKRFSIVKSSVSTLPSFAGHSYVGANPMNLNERKIEDIVQSIADLQIHWQRIERKMHLSKSTLRKRNNMWKKLREEQLKNILAFSN
jgi:hypothetical protein